MSAFTDLLAESDALGVTKLVFEVDPRQYNETDQASRWGCRATVAMVHQTVFMDVLQTRGRTGEEALRHVVEFLKRVA